METLKECFAWLDSKQEAKIELGLARIKRAISALDLRPLSNKTVITVAGTNGKGTTCKVLESLFVHANHTVGVFSSPHLIRFNERIRINGSDISDDELVASFQAVIDTADAIGLSYFEIAFLLALQTFRRHDVDYWVLEVGLGGRLDAVNALDADAAIITPISLDHQSWLGSDLNQIAAEKAGIIRSNKPVIVLDASPQSSITEKVIAVGAEASYFSQDFSVERMNGNACHYIAGDDEFQFSYAGSIPLENIAGALFAYRLITADKSINIDEALADVQLLGRNQELQVDDKHIIIDVAHNQASCQRLAAFVDQQETVGRCVAVFASLEDKSLDDLLSPFLGSFDAWFLCELPATPRATPARNIAAHLADNNINMISVSKNPRQAFARACSLLNPGDRIVVFGSFFTVGPILARLGY